MVSFGQSRYFTPFCRKKQSLCRKRPHTAEKAEERPDGRSSVSVYSVIYTRVMTGMLSGLFQVSGPEVATPAMASSTSNPAVI